MDLSRSGWVRSIWLFLTGDWSSVHRASFRLHDIFPGAKSQTFHWPGTLAMWMWTNLFFFSNFPEQLVSEKGSSQFCQWIDRQSGLFNCQNKICTFFFGTKTSWDSVRCEQSDIYWGVLLTKCPEDYQQRMIFAVSKDVPVCETAKGTDRSSCGWDWGKVLC